jgi:hypothetical protein
VTLSFLGHFQANKPFVFSAHLHEPSKKSQTLRMRGRFVFGQCENTSIANVETPGADPEVGKCRAQQVAEKLSVFVFRSFGGVI